MAAIEILPGTIHELPEDITNALEQNPPLLEIWNALTPLARNEWICFVTIPKKPETRLTRLLRLQQDLSKGKRRPCCWPGCPHHRPNAAKYFGKQE